MTLLRFGIPALFFVLAIAMLAFAKGGVGVEGFFMAAGAGMSMLLLSALWRLGSVGDQDRAREERARDYFSRHGHWPDERRR